MAALSANEVQTRQQTVYATARECGLNDIQAKIITAQATHESGTFQSSLAARANNLFGMTIPHQRSKAFITGNAGKQPDGKEYYAAYANVKDSVKDLILSYHKYIGTDWNKIKTPEDYAAYLKRKGYYGDSVNNYLTALKRVLPKLSFVSYALIPSGLLFFFYPDYFLNKK